MLWENLTVIGSFLFGIVQFVFFCWLAMAILGFILGLMMDPYSDYQKIGTEKI